MKELSLTSVNWEHGMLLTPDHFLRQERYVDDLNRWATRYLISVSGLVGGGSRLPELERGAVRHDPVVTIAEDSDQLNISISQARGLTAHGQIIYVTPLFPLHVRVPKSELAGVSNAHVYVVANPDQKDVVDGIPDEFNPQMKTERSPAYRISLRLQADQVSSSLAVARIIRPPVGSGYEKDSTYIPPCTSLVSYSELTTGWRRIVENISSLSQRYRELHRAMREFLVLFAERGIDTDGDREASAFVERMVIALQALHFELLDPVQSPQRMFDRLRQFFYGTATFLDLCSSVRQYFDTLKETGETEFIALVEQQRQTLETARTSQIELDLAAEVQKALHSLLVMTRLESALEGKYVDFHVSQTLEGMNFIFDRGGRVLFKMVAKPVRLQGVGEDLTIHFAQLRLEGRDRYRLILVGEQNASFAKGYRIPIEIRINEGSGFRREPINLTSEANLEQQFNFDFDFDAPDVATILDVKVTLQAHHPIRTALLFARHRFYSSDPQSASANRLVTPSSNPVEPNSNRTRYQDKVREPAGFEPVPIESRPPSSIPSNPESARPLPPDYRGDNRLKMDSRDEQPPWDKGGKEKSEKPEQDARVRRRRLE